MRIVIDSNILFSILVKSDGRVANLFHLLTEKYELFISDFTFEELNKHSRRLIKISKLPDNDFEKLKYTVLKHLSIIPSNLFPDDIISKAFDLCKDIDLDDLPFVAAAMFLNGVLWTGDMKLHKGLSGKGFKYVYNSRKIELLLEK